MKIKVDAVLKSLGDEELKDNSGMSVTVKSVCIEALMLNYANEQADGATKFKRYEIASKIKTAKEESDLSVEEIVVLKDLIGKAYGPAVVGPMFNILEGRL